MRWLIYLLLFLLVAACDTRVLRVVPAEDWDYTAAEAALPADEFHQISRAVGNEAQAECLRRTTNQSCDFKILVDLNPRAPANAFQTLDKDQNPVIIFTREMIKSTRNSDELAFVMGHEAAHHVLGHIARQTENAKQTAANFGELARLYGSTDEEIAKAQRLGAEVGVQAYAQDFELEADQLGTVITFNAGYNPLIGAKYFERIPDPGDQFLGSHPPNAERVQIVKSTARSLGLKP